MPSFMVTATLQAIAIGSLSNVLAQIISAVQENRPFSFDLSNFLFFLTWTIISCPPNVLFQMTIEDKFPANKVDEKGNKRLSKTNTLKKFMLDQTLSATANTVGYIAAVATYQGKDFDGVVQQVQSEFWPLIRTGWKLWPMVALLSFTVIPFEKRTLFGATVGLFWGIYMSILSAQ